MNKGAYISECGKYRYWLQRSWDGGRGKYVTFIMLNPSTADANIDDPTIRRCIGYAKDWGYSGLTVLNLFAYRATSPKDMKNAKDPIGYKSEMYLNNFISSADGPIICAWGNHGSFMNADEYVLKMIRNAGKIPMALKVSKGGNPSHPLYLKKNLLPKPLDII